MKRHLGTLLCLAGVVACSSEKPARSADDSTEVSWETPREEDPTLTPASYDSAVREEKKETKPAPAEAPDTIGGDDDKAGSDKPRSLTNDLRALDPKAAPDNTSVNKRDADGSSPTPMDQGQSQSDLDITQKIRKAVMANDTLSFTAKNVKIITLDGKVTLRGPVNTPEERASIEALALKIAGVKSVDSQLEVKAYESGKEKP